MLVLYETPAGFALFKAKDDGQLSQVDDWSKEPLQADASLSNILKLKAFSKFETTAEALEAVTRLNEGSMTDDLKKFLKAELNAADLKDKLAVADPKLGKAIAKKLGIQVVCDAQTLELMRGIRSQILTLLSGISEIDMKNMALGLSHSLSRLKLKFSPDKVDTMIIQAIALLDDLDKELNTYCMRLKEWFGWHFPELGKILTDNVVYAKVIRAMGFRDNATNTDFSHLLPEDLEKELKELAEVSMGTEISQDDLDNIHSLADQIISLSSYRTELYEYLKNRMAAIAPNLTALVGELVGARLIGHAGSLMNLAKYPASTVQILGAEKALFRALKTKSNTPKYGLIFHASVIGQASPKLKGKMARVLAAKASLAIRVDALTESGNSDVQVLDGPSASNLGISERIKVEQRLRQLEAKLTMGNLGSARGKPGTSKKYDFVPAKSYNTAADMTRSSPGLAVGKPASSSLPSTSPLSSPPTVSSSSTLSSSSSTPISATSPMTSQSSSVISSPSSSKESKKEGDKSQKKEKRKLAEAQSTDEALSAKKVKADDSEEKKKKKDKKEKESVEKKDKKEKEKGKKEKKKKDE